MDNIDNKAYYRGEIVIVDLGEGQGSELGSIRPCIIVQNNVGNKESNTTIVVPMTSKKKQKLPTHVTIHKSNSNGLSVDSIALCEQVRVIDRCRIKDSIGTLKPNEIIRINSALVISVVDY